MEVMPDALPEIVAAAAADESAPQEESNVEVDMSESIDVSAGKRPHLKRGSVGNRQTQKYRLKAPLIAKNDQTTETQKDLTEEMKEKEKAPELISQNKFQTFGEDEIEAKVDDKVVDGIKETIAEPALSLMNELA